MTGAEAEAAARLLERLLTDAAFRDQFRRNPVAAAREAGLQSVAEEMAMSAGKAMQTLDGRESRSSLAGVFMAAALEGAGVYDFSRDLVPHLEGIPEQVEQVLTRVHSHGGLSAPAGFADLGVPAAAAAGPLEAAAEAPPTPPNAAGEFPAITPEQAAGRSHAPEPLAQPPPEAAPRRPPEDVDPAQYGQEGGGGHASRETLALLQSKRVTFDADGIADLRAGRIDPRVVSVLTAVSRSHRISVSAMASDHPKLTTGGSVSNHFYGRAVDIASVDGRPVGPGNAAARELAVALSRLDLSIRPSEIGSPWALPGPAYFTDGGHQDHIHVAFDEPVASDWKPPEELAASESGTADGDPAPATGDTPAPGSAEDDLAPAVSDKPASGADGTDDAGAQDEGSDDAEPGGLEDPGGDTDAQADAESDGGEDDDSDSDDASDDEEDDENDEGTDGDDSGSDGDHDDNSDASDGSGSGSGESSGDGVDSGESSGDGADSGESSVDGGGSGQSSGDGGDGADGGGGEGERVDIGDVVGSYPSDSAPRARIATWMGSQAQKRGLPAELPVMAALVESDMHNLKYGDADSVGYFQMRVGTWNQGEYAGYPDHAELQLKWFLDQAEAVKKQRVAAGKPVDDPNGYGEWIADIERPRAEYRGRYQLHLDSARELLRQRAEGENDSGSGDADVAVEPVDDDGGDDAGPRALEAVAQVKKQLGTPYQWGGSLPSTGFDCSGLMQWAYAKAGIVIPRTSEQQILASNGKAVDRGHLRPGDLVFFRDTGGDVHHVGISLGGDKFINAPHTGAKVRVDDLSEPYYAKEFAGGRRFDSSSGREQGPSSADASGPDQDEVQRAQAALARDAAEAQRPGTLLFEAVRAEELRKEYHTQTLGAVEPSPST
jgi:putative modified peptide